jgi:hypothetical protein
MSSFAKPADPTAPVADASPPWIRPATWAWAATAVAAALYLSACGGGGSSDASGSPQGGFPAPAPGVALGTSIQAAQATANNTDPNSSCGAISQNASGSDDGFYWEIGTANGIVTDPVSGLVAAGSVQPASASGTNYTRSTVMEIASASKWMYGAYVTEKLATSSNGNWSLPAAAVPYLNFTSGYDNMSDTDCYLAPTVSKCLGLGSNDSQTAAHIGRFDYNSGHLEVLEGGGDPSVATLMNGAGHTDADLASELMNAFAARGTQVSLSFAFPVLAGGIRTSAGDYAAFLQGMLRTNDPLIMSHFLQPTASDPYAVCTNPTSSDCRDGSGQPLAIYTPVPFSLSWHYSITHWIEDDPTSPTAGDGAYSSPGKLGFYPWIDKSKTYYGIVARSDNNPTGVAADAPYYKSVVCGEAIRKAFMTGVVQP